MMEDIYWPKTPATFLAFSYWAQVIVAGCHPTNKALLIVKRIFHSNCFFSQKKLIFKVVQYQRVISVTCIALKLIQSHNLKSKLFKKH